MSARILIVDDHRLFRQGLFALLGETPEWTVVAEAGDGAEAIRAAEETRPDVAVLDVEMPGVSGVEAAREIRRVSPATRIVALTMYGDPHYQEQMRAAGATAYVLKNEAIGDLVDAIRAVLAGRSFTSPSLSDPGAVAAGRSARLDHEELSAREREVLRMLAEGHRTKEIAHALGISPKTVETYRARLMTKLDIDDVPGLVRFAIRAGIVSPKS